MSILISIAKENSSKSQKEILLKIGTVYSKLIGKVPRKIILKIDKKLSYYVVGAEYSKPYKKGVWDGYIHLFHTKYRTFPTGFLKDVQKILNKKNIKFSEIDLRKDIKISESAIQKALTFNKKIKPRSYQQEAVRKALKEKTGIINIPTGTGKTLIINLIINAIDQETNFKAKHLIVSSGLSLLNQLKHEIEGFQLKKVGFIGEGKFDVQRITVASIDSLYKAISNAKNANNYLVTQLLKNSTTLFSDEAHHSPSKTFKKVVQLCNAPFRIGTTATYKRSGGDDMMLKAVTGNVIFKKSISWMTKNGYLAIPTVFVLEFNGEEKTKSEINQLYKKIKEESGKNIELSKIKKMKDWHKDYAVEIAHNDERNNLIIEAFKVLYDLDLSIVLFVIEKFHGEYFKKTLKEKYSLSKPDIRFLSGSDDVQKDRIPTLNSFRNGNLSAIICTRILNEGIDFPEANCGIRAGGMMFDGTIIQQIGRILRKTKEEGSSDINKNEKQRVFWVDICDFHNPVLAKHSLNRIKTYEKQKFDIRYIDNIKQLREQAMELINEVKIIKKDKKNTSTKRK